MEVIAVLAAAYKEVGSFGFLAVVLGFVVVFLVIQQARITKRFFQALDELSKENRRLNDVLVGLSAFIQSFLSVIAEYEDAVAVINEKIKQRLKKENR